MNYVKSYEEYLMNEIDDDFGYYLDDFIDRSLIFNISESNIFTINEQMYLHNIVNGDDILFEGFKSMIRGSAHGIARGVSAVGHGLKFVGGKIVKGTSAAANTALSAVQKTTKIAMFLKDVAKEIFIKFIKYYMSWTKLAKHHNEVLAKQAYQRFVLLKKEVGEISREETQWLKNSIKFLHEGLLKKIKSFYKNIIGKAIKDLANPNESEDLFNYIIYDYLFEDNTPEGNKIKPAIKQDVKNLKKQVGTILHATTQNKGAIGNAIKTEVKISGNKGIPKGLIKGVSKKLDPTIDAIDKFMDDFYFRNKYKYTLKLYAKAIEKLGGPSSPPDGFKNLASLYNFSSTIVDPSPLGGTFWRDKDSIKGGVFKYGMKQIILKLALPGLSLLHTYLIFIKKLDVLYNLSELISNKKNKDEN